MRPKTYEYGNGKKARLYHQTLGIANDSEHGLAGAVYSKDAERAKKVGLQSKRGRFSSISLQARIRNCRLAALRILDLAGR